ncbi:MAG: hypothetical protein IPG07_08975 [Crocinitomicaceae bacterium]|nr:hypothetical protein [Crocinitomicaceae bacterium]
MGVVAVVGTGNATETIKDGQMITVSCAEGKKGIIYDGNLKWKKTEIDTSKVTLPETQVMFILADPGKAFQLAALPNNGVGLMRMEFVVNDVIKVHPMALVNFESIKDKSKQKLKNSPNHYRRGKTILLISFTSSSRCALSKRCYCAMRILKSNEYANLIRKQFEPRKSDDWFQGHRVITVRSIKRI